MNEILKTIELLDEANLYKLADKFQNSLIKLSAFPYNLSALDELPISSRSVDWERIKEDFQQIDDIYLKEKKWRLPEYKKLNTDPDEELNMEGEMHGADPVPGPAYVSPDSPGISPSIAGSVDDFTWDQSHDSNIGPEYWKNLLPKR